MNPTSIVTGSTKGIWKATASLLITEEINVVVCSRNQSDADNTVDELRGIARKAKQRENNQNRKQEK